MDADLWPCDTLCDIAYKKEALQIQLDLIGLIRLWTSAYERGVSLSPQPLRSLAAA